MNYINTSLVYGMLQNAQHVRKNMAIGGLKMFKRQKTSKIVLVLKRQTSTLVWGGKSMWVHGLPSPHIPTCEKKIILILIL